MFRPRFKWIGRYDERQKLLRLFSVSKNHPTTGTANGTPSRRISFGIKPAWFRFHKEFGQMFVVIAGLRIHYHASYGGLFPD